MKKAFSVIIFVMLYIAMGQVPVSAQKVLTACDADIHKDGDNIVNIFDYSLLVSNVFKDPIEVPQADITGDGVVNIFDFSALRGFLFQTCSPTPSPEVSPSPSPVSTPTPSPSPTAQPTATPTPTPSPTPSPSPTPVTSVSYGPQGTVGPDGAARRTCTGVSNCTVCTPSGCNGTNWATKISQAKPGDTLLFGAGEYTGSSVVTIPKGTSTAPITIANYNGEKPIFKVGLQFCSSTCTGGGHAVLEGLSIDASHAPDTYAYALRIETTYGSSRVENIKARFLDIKGGRVEAIRIRGAVNDIEISQSYLDGGRDNHVMKILCDVTSRTVDGVTTRSPFTCSLSKVPERITLTGNRFSKNRSSFFPKAACGDEAAGGSGDLLQLEGAGDVVVQNNHFGFNNYEDCIDIKGEGRVGAALEISNNIIDSTGEKTHACSAVFSGCRVEGLMIHGSQHEGALRVRDNRFIGGQNLFRVGGVDTQIFKNIFENTKVKVEDARFKVFENIYQGSSSCSGASC